MDVGNLVGAGQTTKLTSIVMDDDPIYAYFTVSERDHAGVPLDNQRLKEVPLDDEGMPPGQALSLGNEPDFPHKGYLDWIDNKVDPNTGTIQVRGVFPNHSQDACCPACSCASRCPPGFYQGRHAGARGRALARDQRGYYLYTVDNRPTRCSTAGGAGPPAKGPCRSSSRASRPDDRVVINGLAAGAPGQQVHPLTEEQAKQMAAQQEAAMKAKTGKAEAAGQKRGQGQG